MGAMVHFPALSSLLPKENQKNETSRQHCSVESGETTCSQGVTDSSSLENAWD